MRVSDLILRSIAKRCVSKDDASELESALAPPFVPHREERILRVSNHEGRSPLILRDARQGALLRMR